MTKNEQRLRALRLAREREQQIANHFERENARFASLWGRPSPYAAEVTTRRAAKHGKVTVRWSREHPKMLTHIWPSGLQAMGIS